ncbi:MAG: peptidoglycan-binding protein [Parasporobacterium sp.]|nr:peptidoglycan-binding protein [Parasporobacterium sp.]
MKNYKMIQTALYKLAPILLIVCLCFGMTVFAQETEDWEENVFSLSLRDAGDSVEALQEGLSALGYYDGEPDGVFGEDTMEALIAFQEDYGLLADGVAGPDTMKMLEDFSGIAVGGDSGWSAWDAPEDVIDGNDPENTADGADPENTDGGDDLEEPDEDPDDRIPFYTDWWYQVDEETADQLHEIFDSITDEEMTPYEKLESCFYYIADRHIYEYKETRIPFYTALDWPLVYVDDMLTLEESDCHGYAAMFGFLAALCGYSDDVVWCMTENGDHAWVEIDGLVYDPIFFRSPNWSTWVFGWTYEEGLDYQFGYGYADPENDPETFVRIRVPEF